MKVYRKFGIFVRVKQSRARFAFVFILILCAFIYPLLPNLLESQIMKILLYRGCCDSDFRLHESSQDAGKKEIIILHWTSIWAEYQQVKILNSDKCPYLETGTFQQKSVTPFNIPCRVSFDRRYLSVSDAVLFHSFDLNW